MKNSTSNYVRLAFALGLEHEMLAPEVIQAIPASSRSYWRRQAPEIYEQHLSTAEHREVVAAVRGAERKVLWRVVRRVARSARALESELGRKRYRELLDGLVPEFMAFFEGVEPRPASHRVLRLFNYPESRFLIEQARLIAPCASSPVDKCVKRIPNQTSQEECDRLQACVNVPGREHWPTASLWAQGVRDGKIGMGASTAYRLIRMKGYRPTRVIHKPPTSQGIRAEVPNRIWHGDVSYVRTEDGQLNFIYAIKDNYSKLIVSWQVEREISGKHALTCLRAALKRHPEAHPQIITDGGSEFNNKTMRRFLNRCNRQLTHLIAKRDIRQSNSMIERFFLTIKSESLHGRRIMNHFHLKAILAVEIPEYNNRPHVAHKLYTPEEVHAGNLNFDFEEAKSKARALRLQCNRENICPNCTCPPVNPSNRKVR